MTRSATVVLENGRLMAEVIRHEACQGCHACKFGQSERVLVELPKGDYRPGDVINIEMNDTVFVKSTLLAYAVPLVTFVAGLLIGSAFGGDIPQAIGGAAGIGAGLIVVRLVSRARARCEIKNG